MTLSPTPPNSVRILRGLYTCRSNSNLILLNVILWVCDPLNLKSWLRHYVYIKEYQCCFHLRISITTKFFEFSIMEVLHVITSGLDFSLPIAVCFILKKNNGELTCKKHWEVSLLWFYVVFLWCKVIYSPINWQSLKCNGGSCVSVQVLSKSVR